MLKINWAALRLGRYPICAKQHFNQILAWTFD